MLQRGKLKKKITRTQIHEESSGDYIDGGEVEVVGREREIKTYGKIGRCPVHTSPRPVSTEDRSAVDSSECRSGSKVVTHGDNQLDAESKHHRSGTGSIVGEANSRVSLIEIVHGYSYVVVDVVVGLP